MNKLIASALLSVGIAAGAMAADMPKSGAPMLADAAGTPATATTAKHAGKSGKKSKKSKKTAPAPASR
jgi:hypothetical protein